MANLNKIYGKGGRKANKGAMGKHLAKKKEADDRRAAEALLPPEALCEYCGEMKRAYRDIGGQDDIARICTDCEKKAIDAAIGAPEYEDDTPRSNDEPGAEEEGLADGVEEDSLSEKEKAPARKRKTTKKKKNRATQQKIRRE